MVNWRIALRRGKRSGMLAWTPKRRDKGLRRRQTVMVDLFLRCSALRSQKSNSGLRRRWTAMVVLFLRCPDPRRQPHRWQKGGSLYRHATSDGYNHLAGPSHRQPPLSRTQHLRSVFNRTRWRCRCSPCRRGSDSSHRSIQYLQRKDRSSRRRGQWHLLQQHLRLQHLRLQR